MSEWREKKINQRDSLSVWSDSSCQTPVKSRHCFLSSVPPANFPAKVIRCSEWRKRLRNKQHIGIINFHEEMATGYDSQVGREVMMPLDLMLGSDGEEVKRGGTFRADFKDSWVEAHRVLI